MIVIVVVCVFGRMSRPHTRIDPNDLTTTRRQMRRHHVFDNVVVTARRMVASTTHSEPRFVFCLIVVQSMAAIRVMPKRFIRPSMYVFCNFSSQAIFRCFKVFVSRPFLRTRGCKVYGAYPGFDPLFMDRTFVIDLALRIVGRLCLYRHVINALRIVLSYLPGVSTYVNPATGGSGAFLNIRRLMPFMSIHLCNSPRLTRRFRRRLSASKALIVMGRLASNRSATRGPSVAFSHLISLIVRRKSYHFVQLCMIDLRRRLPWSRMGKP